MPDPARGTRRVTHGLIFTAVYSRHLFVFPTHRQTLEEVIAGFDAAWAFYGGTFAVVIPDNLEAGRGPSRCAGAAVQRRLR